MRFLFLLIPTLLSAQFFEPMLAANSVPSPLSLHDWSAAGVTISSLASPRLVIPDVQAAYAGAYRNLFASTDLGDSKWAVLTATKTADATPDPLGGNRTYRVQIQAGASQLYQSIYFVAGQTYTLSWRLKSNTAGTQEVALRLGCTGGGSVNVVVGTDWAVYTATKTPSVSTECTVGLRSKNDNTVADILAAMPQVESGATANTYEDTPYPGFTIEQKGTGGAVTQDGTATIWPQQAMAASNATLASTPKYSAPHYPGVTLGGDWTFIFAAKATTTTNGLFTVYGAESSPTAIQVGSMLNQSTLWGVSTYVGATFAGDSSKSISSPEGDFNVWALVSRAGVLTLTNLDSGDSQTWTNPGASSTLQLWVAAKIANAVPYGVDNGAIVADAFWAQALTASQAQQAATKWIRPLMPPPMSATAPILVVRGDSIAAGTHASASALWTNWPQVLMANYPGTRWWNSGRSGATTQVIASEWGGTARARDPLSVKTLTPNASSRVALYYAGYNNLAFSADTAATIEASIAADIAQMQAQGYKVVVGTIMQSGLSGARDIDRQTINTWMRGGGSGADAVADHAAIAGMVYDDVIHPNTAGQALMVPVWKAAIDSIVALP